LTSYLKTANLTPDVTAKFIFNDRNLLQALSGKLDPAIARLATNYALLCASLNPKCLESLTIATQEAPKRRLSFQAVQSHPIILASGLALLRESSDSTISQALLDLFTPLQAQATDSMLDDFFRFYLEISHNADGSIKTWTIPFAIGAFRGAKLINVNEKRFFEEVLKNVEDAQAEDCIRLTVAGLEKWTRPRNRECLLAGKRIVFAANLWPRMKDFVKSEVPPDVVSSFPKNDREWSAIVRILA
jgi:hypothetical protein